MPINNNTNRLGTGFRARVTGRDFSDPNASAISGEIARQNYKATFRSDYKLKRLRDYVKKMVSRYSPSDKMAILSEYGDPRMGTSDEAVVQALITNLRESDLELLVKDVMVDEGKLARNVREIRKSKQRQGSRFSTKTFDQVFEASRKARNPRDLQRAVNAYDKSFRIPTTVRRQFTGLGREVVKVLNEVFSPIELSGLAIKMEINFDDGASKKELVNLITNKVLLFVSLVTGRTKAGYAAAIVNEAPYKEVLQYTTYAWAAGVSGMTQDGLKSLRQQAVEAKARSRESFIQKSRAPSRLGGKRGQGTTLLETVFDQLNPVKAVGRVAGLATGGIGGLLGGILGLGQREFGVSLGSLGGGLLGGAKGLFDRVTSLGRRGSIRESAAAGARAGSQINAATGASFGFNPFNFGQRRLQDEALTRADRGYTPETEYLRTLTGQQLLDEAAKFGLRARTLRTPEQEDALRRDIRAKIEELKIRRERLERKGRDLARVGRRMSDRDKGTLGALTSQLKGITDTFDFQGSEKVPYIKFTVTGGPEVTPLKAAVPVFVVNNLFKGSGESEAEMAPKLESINERIKNVSETPVGTGFSQEQKDEALRLLQSDKSNLMSKAMGDRGRIGGGGSSTLSDIRGAIFQSKGALPGMSESIYGSTGERGAEVAKGVTLGANARGVKASNKDYISLSRPMEALVTKGTRALRVFDVSAAIAKGFKSDDNKSRAFFSDQAVNLGVKKMSPEAAKPVYVVNKSVPTDTGKLLLGVAKLLLNFIPFGNLAAGQLDSLASGDGDIASMMGFATGGRGRATGLGRKTTHFISGDSLSKRPNPEQVSINWSDKSYKVKPIPQFSDGGGQSASGQVRRMTPSERNEPMKVYAVNNSLTEMVDVNGQNVSLIGLVSEMNSRLGTIEGLLALGNSNTSSIIKSTTLTATSVGKLSASQPGSGSRNPFANGFPSDLNPILSGA
jgi:hypothetical protein